jgi:DNA polymerase III delta subunit
MRYREALPSLQNKKATKFALIGNEPYLKDSFIQAAKSLFTSSPLIQLNDEYLDEALAAMYSGSLFGSKLIILRRFDKHLDKIQIALEHNQKDIILVEVSESANPKSNKVTGILGQCTRVDCARMREFGNDYPSWVLMRISEEGFEADTGVDTDIYERVGPSLFALENELQKLFIFRRESKYIQRKDVSYVVSERPLSTAYQILESLMRRNLPGVLEHFDSYCQSHDTYIELVMFLTHYMEKVYRMLLLVDQKVSPEGIAEIVGLPRFIVKTKYLPRAQRLGKHFVAQGLDNLIQLDVSLRRSPVSPRALVESFFYQFAAE